MIVTQQELNIPITRETLLNEGFKKQPAWTKIVKGFCYQIYRSNHNWKLASTNRIITIYTINDIRSYIYEYNKNLQRLTRECIDKPIEELHNQYEGVQYSYYINNILGRCILRYDTKEIIFRYKNKRCTISFKQNLTVKEFIAYLYKIKYDNYK